MFINGIADSAVFKSEVTLSSHECAIDGLMDYFNYGSRKFFDHARQDYAGFEIVTVGVNPNNELLLLPRRFKNSVAGSACGSIDYINPAPILCQCHLFGFIWPFKGGRIVTDVLHGNYSVRIDGANTGDVTGFKLM